MKNIKSKIIGLSLLVPLAITGTVLAKGHGSQQGDMFDRCTNPTTIMSELDLTDEQKAQLFDLKAQQKEQRTEHRKNRSENRSESQTSNSTEMQTIHDAMQKLVIAETFDENAAQALIEQKEALREANRQDNRQDKELDRLKNSHAIMSILTAEQKNQFVELQLSNQDECSPKKGGKGHGKK